MSASSPQTIGFEEEPEQSKISFVLGSWLAGKLFLFRFWFKNQANCMLRKMREGVGVWRDFFGQNLDIWGGGFRTFLAWNYWIRYGDVKNWYAFNGLAMFGQRFWKDLIV